VISGLPAIQPSQTVLNRVYSRPNFQPVNARGKAAQGTVNTKDSYVLSLSAEGLAESRNGAEMETEKNEAKAQGVATEKKGVDGEPLNKEETAELKELEKRDGKVRDHEMAHKAALGSYAKGGIQLEYQVGPDGKRYATGGKVSLDASAESTPEKTIAKAQTIRRAALAPADPSSQDRRVAAEASRLEQKARADKTEQDGKERDEKLEAVKSGPSIERATTSEEDLNDLSKKMAEIRDRLTGMGQYSGASAPSISTLDA